MSNAHINGLSKMISDSYPKGLDIEAHRWRRCAKVCEEAGEVVDALLGLAGENPRKGTYATIDHVRTELLDVALTALGAVAYLDGFNGWPMEDLQEHAIHRYNRLLAAMQNDGGTVDTVDSGYLDSSR